MTGMEAELATSLGSLSQTMVYDQQADAQLRRESLHRTLANPEAQNAMVNDLALKTVSRQSSTPQRGSKTKRAYSKQEHQAAKKSKAMRDSAATSPDKALQEQEPKARPQNPGPRAGRRLDFPSSPAPTSVVDPATSGPSVQASKNPSPENICSPPLSSPQRSIGQLRRPSGRFLNRSNGHVPHDRRNMVARTLRETEDAVFEMPDDNSKNMMARPLGGELVARSSSHPARKRGRPANVKAQTVAATGAHPASSVRMSRVEVQELPKRQRPGPKKRHVSKKPRESAPGRMQGQNEESEGTHNAETTGDDADGEADGGYNESGLEEGSEIRDEDHDPSLLGKKDAWEEILEAARKNCPDRASSERDIGGNKRARPVTKTIRDLIQTMKKANVRYKSLAKGQMDQSARQDAESELAEILNDMDEQIHDIREFDIDTKGSKKPRIKGGETIQDLYLRAIPDMVYLLRTAMRCRALEGNEIYNYKGIQEIVRLQNMILHLCRKAESWQAAPLTKRPIIKPIRSKLFPALSKRFAPTFKTELDTLRIQEKKKQNRLKHGPGRIQNLQSSPSQQEIEEQTSVILRQIDEGIKRTVETIRAQRKGLPPAGLGRRSVSAQPRQASIQPPEHQSQWTRDEERELIIQLQNRHSRDLPAEERYLRILNTPLLQNKLPEHIREKALSLKPFLLEVLEDRDYINCVM